MASGTEDDTLEEIQNENVDLTKVHLEEVFQQLNCSREGLSTTEGEKRFAYFGPNKLEEKKESKFLKFLRFTWNPLSWVMECAAIMAIALAHGGNSKINNYARDVPEYQDRSRSSLPMMIQCPSI